MIEILKYKTSNSKYVKAIYSDKLLDGKKVKYTFKNWEHSYFMIHLMIPVRNIIPDFLYVLKI